MPEIKIIMILYISNTEVYQKLCQQGEANTL